MYGIMLKLTRLDAENTQNADFYTKIRLFQTTSELKVWIQTFAKNSDQSGRPEYGVIFVMTVYFFLDLLGLLEP